MKIHTLLRSIFFCFCGCSINLTALSNTANDENQQLTQTRKAQLIHMIKQDCGSCHGMTLKGGLGPALLPENVKDKPISFLQSTILYGRPGTAMPPWNNILTQQEASWISKKLQQGLSNEI